MKLRQQDGDWRLHAETPGPIRHLLSALRGRRLALAAAAVRAGHGLGLDGVGFDYPSDCDEDDEDEPLDGVAVYDPFDEEVLSEDAFSKLMLAAFDAWLTQPVDEPWWARFREDVEAIRERRG